MSRSRSNYENTEQLLKHHVNRDVLNDLFDCDARDMPSLEAYLANKDAARRRKKFAAGVAGPFTALPKLSMLTATPVAKQLVVNNVQAPPMAGYVCHTCGVPGHKKYQCPSRPPGTQAPSNSEPYRGGRGGFRGRGRGRGDYTQSQQPAQPQPQWQFKPPPPLPPAPQQSQQQQYAFPASSRGGRGGAQALSINHVQLSSHLEALKTGQAVQIPLSLLDPTAADGRHTVTMHINHLKVRCSAVAASEATELVRISASIEGITTVALIDSGSEASLLRTSAFRQIRVDDALSEEKIEIVGALEDGSSTWARGVRNCAVELQDGTTVLHKFILCDQLHEPRIFGLDFIRAHSLALVPVDQELTVSRLGNELPVMSHVRPGEVQHNVHVNTAELHHLSLEREPVQLIDADGEYTHIKPPPPIRVLVDQHCSLRPGYSTVVQVKFAQAPLEGYWFVEPLPDRVTVVADGGDAYVDDLPVHHHWSDRHLVIEPVAVHQDYYQSGEADRFNIVVTNMSARPIHMQPGQVIGAASEVVDMAVPTPASVARVQAPTSQADDGLHTTVRVNRLALGELLSHLSTDHQSVLQQLLNEYDQRGLFASNAHVHATNLGKHVIELVPGQKHKFVSQYPLSNMSTEEVNRQVRELLEAGVIEPTRSPFNSPVLLVRKPDGTWRFCLDFRHLNMATIPDLYPMNRQDLLLANLQGMSVFSTMDLKWGFWQVEIEEFSRRYTAFSVPQVGQ